MFISFYCGYTITHSDNRPATGQWRAERYGVGLCSNSKESLIRMIDVKCYEEEQARKARNS